MLTTLHYRIHEVVPYINWTYFFHAWGFPPHLAGIAQIHGCDACRASWLASQPEAERQRAAEAMQLHKEALRMLNKLDEDYKVHVRFGLFDCNSHNEDIVIYQAHSALPPHEESSASSDSGQQAQRHEGSGEGTKLSLLRQQEGDYLCLADFIRPMNAEDLRDRIGIFAACADEAIEHQFEDGTPQADDYRHLLCQTLADRLAEAATERAHEAIRRHYWGYAPDERLSITDLHAERFQGIRPAVGYPSLPDQSINFDLDQLIDFSSIGIRLTESGAMLPHASVSGLMLAHPQAHYFAIGHIGDDQLRDYAQRKGRTPEEMRPFLAANLL